MFQIPLSTLTLLVPGIDTNNADNSIAPDDLAIPAHLLDTGHDFHVLSLAHQAGLTPPY
jgi:hypothetical protein